ncbi:hypothetical protein CICLE_v10013789mg [Citrus x clementina]|uniref:Uncharacterized protein n=1 Tax=Citrus clementina TaxID=85681 RepID=V4SSV7_CITCL|nr:hypothetical protein CICLE_v10013645mg [Citrus x clementina]ESR42050.1 hypothetical protein CICLE_v10013789mg [Citrus x clementina]
MENVWRASSGQDPNPVDYKGIEFWFQPGEIGPANKARRLHQNLAPPLVHLKQGEHLWFKDSHNITRGSTPRGFIPVGTCLTVKCAEDGEYTMYSVADTEKEKGERINSIGRAIVQHSRSVTESEVVEYDSKW